MPRLPNDPDQFIQRKGSPGDLDLSFRPAIGVESHQQNSSVHAIAIQEDGRILIGGHFETYDGVPRVAVARLQSTGLLDSSFDPAEGLTVFDAANNQQLTGTVGDLAIRRIPSPSGDDRYEITVVGLFTHLRHSPSRYIARLDDAGNKVPSFSSPFEIQDGRESEPPVEEGSERTAIHFPGSVGLWQDQTIVSQSFRRCGDFERWAIARLGPTGSCDASYAHQSKGSTGSRNVGAGPSLVLPDGSVLFGGNFDYWGDTRTPDGTLQYEPRPRIARFTPSGGLDRGFGPAAYEDANGTFHTGRGPVHALARQTDGKFLVVGNFFYIKPNSNTELGSLVRLHSDGSWELPGPQLPDGIASRIFAIAVEPQPGDEPDKILIAGDFQTYGDVPRNRLARLHSDGSLDTSFDPGEGPNGPVKTLAVQPDGSLLIGGSFTEYAGRRRHGVARVLLHKIERVKAPEKEESEDLPSL
ncbi:MAG: delta-60 repeat domain-containing protein [Deltaproteobacteria bacterium]|nr:delta-60 repeat domain-containing protein [Deltaproteobacteria bacterium]